MCIRDRNWNFLQQKYYSKADLLTEDKFGVVNSLRSHDIGGRERNSDHKNLTKKKTKLTFPIPKLLFSFLFFVNVSVNFVVVVFATFIPGNRGRLAELMQN